MNNKELNLLELVKLLVKNKMLFSITFLAFLGLSTFYVLNIEKTYKSVLIAKLPLNNGLETEYLLNELSTYKPDNLNIVLELNNNEVKSMSLEKVKYSGNEIYGVINIETLIPDTSLEVKNKLIAYVNKISFFDKLIEIERAEKKAVMTGVDIDSSGSKNTYYFNPLAMKKMEYQAKKELAYLAPIVEIQYTPFTKKYKPSYSMLLILGGLFSFFMALGITVLKIGFLDVLAELSNER